MRGNSGRVAIRRDVWCKKKTDSRCRNSAPRIVGEERWLAPPWVMLRVQSVKPAPSTSRGTRDRGSSWKSVSPIEHPSVVYTTSIVFHSPVTICRSLAHRSIPPTIHHLRASSFRDALDVECIRSHARSRSWWDYFGGDDVLGVPFRGSNRRNLAPSLTERRDRGTETCPISMSATRDRRLRSEATETGSRS